MTEAEKIDLSIVIPAYREESRVGATLEQLASYLNSEAYFENLHVEVIVVAADAPDKTHEVVISNQPLFYNFKLIKPGTKVGKGRDVKVGMLAAGGEAVMFMDADLATPLKYIEVFHKLYKQGNEIVIATRDMYHLRSGILRVLVSTGGNILYRFASGVWIEDSQCGFKLFSSRATKICFSNLQILGWGFDMEVLAIAKANGLLIETVLVSEWEAIENGSFEDHVLANSLRALVDLMHILYRRLSRKYKQAAI